MLPRKTVLSHIRRLAEQNGGTPLGVRAFAAATGITQAQWCGVHWARWGDALVEAGYPPNALQPRFNSAIVLGKVATLTQALGKVPTYSEMRLARRSDPSFPNDKTVANHFGNVSRLVTALREFCSQHHEFVHLLDVIPPDRPQEDSEQKDKIFNAGLVYLLGSGDYYKIGRSETIERRVKEISVALPQELTLVHAIRTDDPPGIEAYWHRRFADRRAKGEWFALSRADVAAFKQRKFQ